MLKDIADTVIQAIRQGDPLTLTLRMYNICLAYALYIVGLHCIVRFPFSKAYSYLRRTYNEEVLNMIHASLNCRDRVGALIRAERLRQYLAGTAIASKFCNIFPAYA